MNKISFRQKEYMYSYHIMQSPQGFQLHLHHYYEFLYMQQGEASYLVEGTNYEAKAGDLLITRPNELHTIIFPEPCTYERQFIQLSSAMFTNLELDLLAPINRQALGKYNRIEKDLVEKYKLIEYFEKIQYYVLNRLPESDLMIKTYAIQFLVQINKIFNDFNNDLTMKKQINPRIEAITEYIDANVSSQITLDELASLFFINKYHMCHTFKQNIGMSIKEYINTRRIAKAKMLLHTGDDITSICFQCGFNDYSTFYKTFKRFTGKSPRKFLK